MEDFAIYLYTILALLVGALIFLLKKSGADQNEEPEANERARVRPAGPAQAGPAGRRRNFNRRNRVMPRSKFRRSVCRKQAGGQVFYLRAQN